MFKSLCSFFKNRRESKLTKIREARQACQFCKQAITDTLPYEFMVLGKICLFDKTPFPCCKACAEKFLNENSVLCVCGSPIFPKGKIRNMSPEGPLQHFGCADIGDQYVGFWDGKQPVYDA